MCLALPGRIIAMPAIDAHDTLRMGRVDFDGVVKEICLACVPDTHVGDYVMVHAGMAIAKVDETEAQRIFTYLKEVELTNAPD